MRKASYSLVVLFVMLIAGCGGGGGSTTASTASLSTIYESLPGTWDMQFSAPYTSCSTLDLGSYAGEGQAVTNTITTNETGTFKYVTLADSSGSVEYNVTTDSDPFKMERTMDSTRAFCFIIDTILADNA